MPSDEVYAPNVPYRTWQEASQELDKLEQAMAEMFCPLSCGDCQSSCIMYMDGSVTVKDSQYLLFKPRCKWVDSLCKKRS